MKPPGGMQSMNPVMSGAEIAAYEDLLKNANCVLEYGTGGSTLLAVRHTHLKIYAVESDKSWIEKLRQFPEIQSAERENRLIFIHADIGPTGVVGRPTDTRFKRRWPNYSAAPWQDKSFSPDVILIDGRFRVACALQAVIHMKSSAVIAVHDFQRRGYKPILLFFSPIQRVRNLFIGRRRRFLFRSFATPFLIFYKTYYK
jgi:hypothetical protein